MTTDETAETKADAADNAQDGEGERRQARSAAPKVIETPQDGDD